MISSLSGVVSHVGLDRLTIVVGGVGLLVHTTPGTVAVLRPRHEVTMATTLVVREDSLTLFGFSTVEERDMFETVQSVSGVGPRIALAMLSVMGPDELGHALSVGDTAALTKVPGIGPKSAQRLILELKDKMGSLQRPAAGAIPGRPSSGARAWRDQVSEALVGLGWSAKQADVAVDQVAGDAPEDADISTYLRLALRELRR